MNEMEYLTAKPVRLFASCVYEMLLLLAIWMITVAVFLVLFGGAHTLMVRRLLQISLWLIAGGYFVWQWQKSGQTLPAQTWRLKLVRQDGELLSFRQASLRYLLASVSFLLFGLGFFWALLDKNGLFLHDRILKTRFLDLRNR